MTRPQIIRADTIDLQDQTSPSAQDHSRKPPVVGIGPAASSHQASELRHVQEERHSEAENLSHAWNQANGLSDEPPSDDERDFADGMHDQQQNGGQAGNGAEHETADGESGDDMDDDMMDKISSSPSISDGGLFSLPLWPKRRSSRLAPTPPPTQTPPRDCSSNADGVESDESSPFSQTPTHLPLSFASPFTLRSGRFDSQSRPSTPLELETDSSSPFTPSPAHLPLYSPRRSVEVQSKVHHRFVEYIAIPGYSRHDDEGFDEESIDEFEDEKRDILGPLYSEQNPACSSPRHEHEDPIRQQPQLVKSASDIELERQLLPTDDPLLDSALNNSCSSYDDNDEAWETESDSPSDDSFESADFNHNDDDETEDLSFPTDSRFVDSGWGGECLRETEDIDFEFVYALHTFVATVEGQANAQKGDTMVLLDDSNSYWWLVRVVKDSTIGYLPAEHIETPTERLARLNKHRNLDLSQTMLGDTTEKSKNPLKKAMRRRNAKTVTFSAPTYVEPSDYEFSSDEEMDDDSNFNGEGASEETDANKAEDRNQDEISTVAPLSVQQVKRDVSPEKGDIHGGEDDGRRRGGEDARTSDEMFDRSFTGPGKSRNGTVRNTDSFFRDESIETRKITLTPNILRDDSNPSGNKSLEKERVSFELLQPDSKEKVKEDKKKKEKKPGMLSGLFKRKDKKKGGSDTDVAKLSGETVRDSPTMDLEDSPIEKQLENGGPVRSSSRGKLQKSPPGPLSPTGVLSPTSVQPLGQADPAVQKHNPDLSGGSSDSTPRATSPDKASEKPSLSVQTPQNNSSSTLLSDFSNKLRSPSGEGLKREKVKRAKQREALDVESSPEEEKSPDPFADSFEAEDQYQAPPSSSQPSGAVSSTERLSESPVHITSADAVPDSEPPALVGDSSSNSSTDELASLRSSPSPPVTSATITDFGSDPLHFQQSDAAPQLSPSLSESPSPNSPMPAPLSFSRPHPPISLAPPPPTRSPPPQPGVSPLPLSEGPARNNSTSTTASLISPPMSPPWSDAHLRAYLDNPSDIRDLLLVVHDTTGVVPVGPDHPLMTNLYSEERGKVQEMNLALDGILGTWLAKKKERSMRKVGANGARA